MKMRRSLQRAGVVLGTALVAVLAVAGAASAHVTVNPNTATQGGYTKVTFRVPNERDDATTTTLEVDLPTDTPIPDVSVKPVTGWTVQVDTEPLPAPITMDDGDQITQSVQKITWTAAPGSEIQPGQFQEFDVSLGPLPTADQVVFKALQTYSSGEIVRWIGDPGDDNPAPVLHLTPAAAAATSSGTGGVAGWGLGLGIAGTIIGLAGLGFGYLAYRRGTAVVAAPAPAATAKPRPRVTR